VILVINEGEANIELVSLREQQQEEEPLEVQRYRVELFEDDIYICNPSSLSICRQISISLLLVLMPRTTRETSLQVCIKIK